IDRMIADFRAVVASDPQNATGRDLRRHPALPHGAGDDAGFVLRAALFDPLIPATGGRTRLILAPDGDLSRLPFEALPDSDGQPLLMKYQFSYVGCGRDVLRFNAEASGQPAEALVVADPQFDLA